MVVLESSGMLNSASNQYLQPDYLSPLPTVLDAKKSPLALLAQTCSQIGADSSTTKALLPPLEKTKKSHSSASNDPTSRTNHSPQSHKQDRTTIPSRASPPETNKLAFKPYEMNVLAKKPNTDDRPSSKTSSTHDEGRKSVTEVRTPSRKSSTTPNSTATPTPGDKSSSAPPVDREKSETPPQGASPIIRSGLEILQGHPKDVPLGTYKPGSVPSSLPGLNSLSSMCSGCPPGLDPSNPAFRPPFAGGPFSHHHAALLAAGFPGSAPGPYVSYARVKTAAGGEALVPVCKDPYCTGCQFSMHNMLMGSGGCPSGCTQCDHQKYNLAAAAALGMLQPSLSPYAQLGRPYVCNWMVGEAYCGKRFTTPDELLQHLRTHTSPSSADPAATAAAAAAAAATSTASMTSLLNTHSLYSSAALHRAATGYPNPPLSPLSAARYHPYSKPGLPGALGASPFSAFNPTLGPYYSPYSLYGQRIGAAVHP